ncbi:hypothetical protein [Methylobacterium planeticum]|uniref:Uncharacterized protein n=1 Tax=Methylobacterium planeticum TaxID=2615211 RepID=A0A6N6MWQ3_9HYPH|nr:hypothetical protein [Methylobacterium planeticum]KAB1074320.1 hypothetical protein F6X51_08050 [Methylobacterium planeticum]
MLTIWAGKSRPRRVQADRRGPARDHRDAVRAVLDDLLRWQVEGRARWRSCRPPSSPWRPGAWSAA